MTREEAKAILKGFMENPLYSDIPKVCRAFDMAIKALEQEPKTRWIPVSERLPEKGGDYLVTTEYNGKVIGVDAASYSPVEGYIDKHWDTFNDWKEDEDSCYHVTAWMPLPEPYEPTN